MIEGIGIAVFIGILLVFAFSYGYEGFFKPLEERAYTVNDGFGVTVKAWSRLHAWILIGEIYGSRGMPEPPYEQIIEI